jgi:two-component system chemotaxis sensor kinase CheA
MENHPIYDDDMQEIVESFVVETTEIFDGLESDILRLEQDPDDEELVDRIFRSVHTVKGTSGFLSLEQLSVLAHHFEEVLGKLRDGERDFDPAMTDVMLTAFDHMKVLTQQVVDRDLQPLDLDDLLAALTAISEGTFDPDDPTVSLPDASPGAARGDGAPADSSDTDAPSSTSEAPAAADSTDANDNRARPSGNAPDTIRVDVERLNALMDLVGELVLGRNRLLQLVSDLRAQHAGAGTESASRRGDLMHALDEATDQVDFTTTELQSAVMRTRMVPIGQVFGKFPRVVRDLAREFDKKIDLVVEGEDTELDKSLVEDLGDPLVHLIRNAADHGIEPPEERKARGKDPCGQIRLTAAHEGNHIVIQIADDGAGLDADALRAQAVEKGLVPSGDAEDMSDAEAYQMIFRPGFSTATAVSQVSGRGVGMDVVKTNLAALNGTIDIDSTPGEGTCFTLKLPLTLAIIQSMLVKSGAETFALPLYAVSEAIRLDPDSIETIRGREVMEHRGRVVPLIRLDTALDVPVPNAGGKRAETAPSTDTYAVIVNVAHRQAALIVDDLIEQEEVVIKPLGEYLTSVSGVAGTTILGDGQVIMILDAGEIIQMQSTDAPAEPSVSSSTSSPTEL